MTNFEQDTGGDRDIFDEGELYIDEEMTEAEEFGQKGRSVRSTSSKMDILIEVGNKVLSTELLQQHRAPHQGGLHLQQHQESPLDLRTSSRLTDSDQALDLSLDSRRTTSKHHHLHHHQEILDQNLNLMKPGLQLTQFKLRRNSDISYQSDRVRSPPSSDRFQNYGVPPGQPARSAAPPVGGGSLSQRLVMNQTTVPSVVVGRQSQSRSTVRSEEDTAKSSSSGGSSVWNLTMQDMKRMLTPYVAYEDKKNVCSICSIKFPSLEKAYSHIENKHIDCFQYKCPLCRTTKTSRLAFDCHVRSRHSVEGKQSISPLLRLKRPFTVKADKYGPRKSGSFTAKTEKKKGSYDFLFLTFLRNELNLGPAMSHEEATNLLETIQRPSKSSSSSSSFSLSSSPSSSSSREGSLSPRLTSSEPASLATWVSREQGIIKIDSKDQFARKWFLTKGIRTGSWELLEEEVLSTFQDRSIIKIISNLPTIIQVFCVRQLLL